MINLMNKIEKLRLKVELGIYIDHIELPEGVDMIGTAGIVILIEGTYRFMSWEEYDRSIKEP